MLLKITRTQRTRLGLLRANVAYDMDNEAHKDVIDRLMKAGFAKKTNKKQLEKEAVEIAEIEAAALTPNDEDGALDMAAITAAFEAVKEGEPGYEAAQRGLEASAAAEHFSQQITEALAAANAAMDDLTAARSEDAT